MTHPAKDLLIAIAEGKQMEREYKTGWCNVSPSEALAAIASNLGWTIRIARPMVERTVRYPEPLRVKPKFGAKYWWPCASVSTPVSYIWHNEPIDNAIFNAGMAFATEADAAEAHKALFGGGQ